MLSRTVVVAIAALTVVPIAMAQVPTVDPDQISNWPAPLYWQPGPAHSPEPVNRGRIREEAAVKTAATTVPTPAVFVAMTPCRVMDTRFATSPPSGPFGAPSFAEGEIRTVAIPTGPCAVPSNAVAYSVNIAVVPTPPGSPMRFLTAWDTGSPQPNASTLNDKAGLVTSNSAVVPTGTGGSINIFVTDPTDLVIDINGYYASQSDLTTGNTAVGIGALANNTRGNSSTAIGVNALNQNTIGFANTAVGDDALAGNTAGDFNTAIGLDALISNTFGNFNTANGVNALTSNTSGNSNTAVGGDALFGNSTGNSNTATGFKALYQSTTGNFNTAIGDDALQGNTTGNSNTAIGDSALWNNTTAGSNTAIGFNALYNNTTGINDIAIGAFAGFNVSSGNNIHIGSQGSSSDSSTIRIGGSPALDPVTQTRFFASGIRGITTANSDAIPVLIDSAGQLGTASSSRRVKRDIEDMGDTTDTILALRPVQFRYEPHGPDSPIQYGLIAEEVAKVAPELVARDKDGRIETVYYDKVNAMLLNEVQKLHRRLAELEGMVRGSGSH